MSLVENFKMLAVYNQRMNKQLLDVCEKLSDEQLTQDTHSFFPTVLTYWNHILFGDLIMLRRLINNNIVSVDKAILAKLPIAKSTNDQFANNLEEFSDLRTLVDELYIKITNGLSLESCSKTVSYTTTAGENLERNVGKFFQHIFNHQTHHRGQLTCILSQFGFDFGCTDLPIIVPE